MGYRENLTRLIEKKEQELARLESDAAHIRAYLEGLNDALKALPKEVANGSVERQHVLRPNSALAKAREALMRAKQPLYIDDLLLAVGKDIKPENRISLAGTLSSYVRNGKVFTKTAPNTFGLVEFADETTLTEPGGVIAEY
jgi:hypothetical protein